MIPCSRCGGIDSFLDGDNICQDCSKDIDKCQHENGWVSVRKQTIFLTRDKEVIFGKETDRWTSVLCQCNRKCGAKRKLYFDKNGKFMKFGRIIKKKDALVGTDESGGKK